MIRTRFILWAQQLGYVEVVVPIRLAYKHTVFPMRSRVKYRWLSDKLICVSQAAQQVVIHGGVPIDRTAVIYGGCRPADRDAAARAWAEAEFGLAKSDRLLVSVGNLLACKGHADLIDAVAILVKANPSFPVTDRWRRNRARAFGETRSR